MTLFQAAFALQTLIDPHIDKARARKVLSTWMRRVDVHRANQRDKSSAAQRISVCHRSNNHEG
jgi:hypothetical protein